jgi:Concanavalin A-like lectin/glucanases superfamily
MRYKRGSLIGIPVSPTSLSAYGFWTLGDAYAGVAASIWPAYLNSFTASYLVVAGGASGGAQEGGGGGAGGYLAGTVNLSNGIAYTVTVGSGGAAIANGVRAVGNNGNNSVLSGSNITTITAIGGGGGAAGNYLAANSGGSGGGGAYLNTTGASGTTGQGNAGGSGIVGGNYGGGGGGGAGSIGGDGTTTAGGNGGSGSSSTITGSTVYYAGGGGGGTYSGGTAGLGGSSIGGTGGNTTAGGTAGAINTGSGGGGGYNDSVNFWASGAGGSGIALISSPYVAAVSSLSGSPTIIGLPSYTNYSGSFNGTSQYLSVPNSSNLALGTGDFTVETWFYVNNNSAAYWIIDSRNIGSDSGFNIFLETSSGYNVRVFTNGAYLITATTTITPNTWYHVAFVRRSGISTIYVNGQGAGSVTDSTNYTQTGILRIGVGWNSNNWFPGYISNVRINKGTALYTSNFTPSTVPLTAITGTQLLTLQNATITDTSTNAFTITNNGSVATTSTVQPFPQAPITSYVYNFTSSGSLTYTTNTFLNYAASFNGSSQYLTAGTGSSFNFGTGNFTIEFWIKTSTTTTNCGFLQDNSIYSATSNWLVMLNLSGISGKFTFWNANNVLIDVTGTVLNNNAWHHVAIVRTSTTNVTIFVDGTSIGSATISSSLTFGTGNGIMLGAQNGVVGARDYTGYISNLRIIKSTALYTSNFTPPTTHLTAVSGTQLLTCQNAALVDNSLNNFAVTNNNTVTTTYTTVPFNY